MFGGGSKPKPKPKASEVAAETRRSIIPTVRKKYGGMCRFDSALYAEPLEDLQFDDGQRPYGLTPLIHVLEGDPVSLAVQWAEHLAAAGEAAVGVPFVCSANEKRAGGDWETGVAGYEERLCRRSTLSATLSNPAPGTYVSNYPIPISGGIFSDDVVVFRDPANPYDKLPSEQWRTLPVCSVAPVRRPKLTQNGTKYSFDTERSMVKNKLRAALRICVYKGYDNIVVGDFGLGNSHRNPPQEMAELWREVILWDADLRGRISAVTFVFDDSTQNTSRLILDDLLKKNGGSGGGSGSSGKGKSKSKSNGSSSSTTSSSGSSAAYAINTPTDVEIFRQVFDTDELSRVLSEPDPRFQLDTLMSPM